MGAASFSAAWETASPASPPWAGPRAHAPPAGATPLGTLHLDGRHPARLQFYVAPVRSLPADHPNNLAVFALSPVPAVWCGIHEGPGDRWRHMDSVAGVSIHVNEDGVLTLTLDSVAGGAVDSVEVCVPGAAPQESNMCCGRKHETHLSESLDVAWRRMNDAFREFSWFSLLDTSIRNRPTRHAPAETSAAPPPAVQPAVP